MGTVWAIGLAWAMATQTLDDAAAVETLYRIERDAGFEPHLPAQAAARDFAAIRLAAAADMLAVLWLAAWASSAEDGDESGLR